MMQFEIFNQLHLYYIISFLIIWTVIPFLSSIYLDEKIIQKATLFLIISSVGLDIFDDIYRIYDNNFTLQKDLPLHLCGFSVYLGAYTLYKKHQLGFELCYFWGIGGALQAILTPDTTGYTNAYHIFAHQVSHGIIVLNVLWMIIVLKMRFRKFALLRTIAITNILLLPIAAINYILGPPANYFYICEKPISSNPFIMGEWPFYLFYLEIFAILILGLINLPMILLNKIEHKKI